MMMPTADDQLFHRLNLQHPLLLSAPMTVQGKYHFLLVGKVVSA